MGRKLEDLIGKRYGKLVVIDNGKGKKRKNSSMITPTVICKCDCGNIVEVVKSRLKSGHTKSCGCLAKEYRDLTGEKFGKWTVEGLNVEKSRGKAKYWNCLCDCGNKRIVLGSNLICG